MAGLMGSTRRGRILRDTSRGDGLVFVDGKQYLFRLEGMWKSEFAPKVNMLVDVAFDDAGRLTALRSAPVEAVAAEQTAQALSAAKATTRTLAEDVRSDAVPALVQYAQAIGYPTLVAIAALLLGWFYFSYFSMAVGVGGRLGVTFYGALKFLNIRGIQDLVSGGSAGIYGLLCLLCCGAVLLPWLWRDRRANYAMLAPLVFMLLASFLIHHKFSGQMSDLQSSASQFGPAGDPRMRQFAAQFANSMVVQLRNSISLGFGAYLSLAACLYLAWRGTRRAMLGDDEDGTDSRAEVESPGARRPPASGQPGADAVPGGQRNGVSREYFQSGSRPPASPSR